MTEHDFSPRDDSARPPSSGAAPSVDMAVAFAAMGRIRLDEHDLHEVLARIADLAKGAVPGASEASVTLLTGGRPETFAHTGALALELDEKQYELDDGPCLSAARDHEAYLIADMASDRRWRAFAATANAAGVRTSLSTGIPIRGTTTGALNVYSVHREVFDGAAQSTLRTFAGYAAVALANAHLYSTTAALAEQMAEAMKTRAVIEQAKGILIAQQHVSAEEAFGILRRASQAANRKLNSIAQAIVDGAQRGARE